MNKDAQKVYAELKNNPRYEIVGCVDPVLRSTKKEACRILGTFSDIYDILRKYRVEEILCAQECFKEKQGDDIIDFCSAEHIAYRFIPSMRGFHYARAEIDFITDLPVIALKPTPLDGWGRVIKRAFDMGIAFLALLLLSPLFFIIGIGIKLDSNGPVFYKSKRVGQAGKKLFFMYKFRSMRTDADMLKQELLSQNERKGPLFKIKNDPRITRFGKFLRKTTMDELPQLLNVLKGELSLVGPRAHLPEEVAKYEKHHKIVLEIKPGVTGLAQINGRSDLDFEDEVKFDTFYIKNWSFWLDIKIILKTVKVVFGGKGAD